MKLQSSNRASLMHLCAERQELIYYQKKSCDPHSNFKIVFTKSWPQKHDYTQLMFKHMKNNNLRPERLRRNRNRTDKKVWCFTKWKMNQFHRGDIRLIWIIHTACQASAVEKHTQRLDRGRWGGWFEKDLELKEWLIKGGMLGDGCRGEVKAGQITDHHIF